MTSAMERWMVAVVAIVVTTVGGVPMAAAGGSDAGTYGAPFLSIPVGARQMASTDVVVGMSPDASVLFTNPAFLAGVPNTSIFFSTSNWLEELRLSSASLSFPLGRAYTLSVGSSFLYSGGLQGYDDALNVVTEEDYYDLGATAAVARRFGMGLSLGFGGTYIRQHLYPEDGSGYAFNVGASFERANYLVHLDARNIGGKVSFSDVNYTVDSHQNVGLARLFSTGWGNVYTGAQVVFSSSLPTRLELGVDYQVSQLFALRAALKDVSGAQSDNLGLDAGFGVHYRKISLEYAYTPHDYFSSTHTFSLVLAPGATGESSSYLDEEADEGKSETSRQTAPPRETPPAKATVDPAVAAGAAAATAVPLTTKEQTTPPQSYLIVSGTHSWESSANAEARSYEVLNIPATVEKVGDKYRVVIGRYDSRKDAVSAINKYKKSGQRFRLVVESGS